MEEVKAICDIIECVTTCLQSEMLKGCNAVDTNEAGEVADILKDLTESKKNLLESKYYELVSEAMENTPYNNRMGYNPDMDWSPRKDNYRMGYNNPNMNWDTFKPMVDQKSYVNDYLKNPSEFSNSMYGREYDSYKRAKKYYTDTDDEVYKEEMDSHTLKHMSNVVNTVKEMWADADSTHKAKIKAELSSLLSSM